MTLQQRQELLAQQIKSVDNEEVLAMLEQELSFFLDSKSKDITDGLTQYQIDELISLAQEPSDKDIITEEEFRKATERWRTKLFLNSAFLTGLQKYKSTLKMIGEKRLQQISLIQLTTGSNY